MSTTQTTSAQASALRIFWPMLVIAGLAINLRPTVTATGPLLEKIIANTGLGLQSASLLTVLPMLCMGLIPLLLPWLERRFSESRLVTAGLFAIAMGSLWRLSLDDSRSLIASALLAGTGIAIVQAIIPSLVKRWYPQHAPLAMGGYSASLMAGGGIAAMLSPLVAKHYGSWQSGLGIWLFPAFIALLLWWSRPRENLNIKDSKVSINFFGKRRAWLLAGYFGLANGGYACMVAWLPSYAQELGWSAQDSGELIGIMTVFQVIGALAAPLLCSSRLDRRPWLFFALAIQLVGFSGLILAPELMLNTWVSMIGCGLGACFALTLTVTLDHLSTPKLAGALTAFVQGVGFIITATTPYIAGVLREWTGSFQASWLMLLLSLMLMLAITIRLSPASYAKAMSLSSNE
ncbi:CynX/NimT family MFS transporter [Shewanella baltica]|uniref:CynX/NimT family MFS transporter n=1 Tax=Shewanella baltica TaxID=62322 RepID=UPI0028729ACE|nr:CynX/NimT family MFS transporter [Shewanella baltica]MDR9764683.1 CynX/NimT family MFS transporter [Shewanella baltica]